MVERNAFPEDLRNRYRLYIYERLGDVHLDGYAGREALTIELRDKKIEGGIAFQPWKEGLSMVISEVKSVRPFALPAAVHIATELELWEIENSVQRLKDSSLYTDGFYYPAAQFKSFEIKNEVDTYFKTKNIHQEVKRALADPLPPVFAQFIETLDMSDFTDKNR